MGSETYEIISLGMRYLLLALMALFVLQLVMEGLQTYQKVRRMRFEALSAASLAYLEVSAPETLAGERFIVYREVLIGSSGRCDICVKKAGLSKIHASLYEKKGAVYLNDQGGRGGVRLNGERLKKDLPMLNGDRINLGKLELYLHTGAEAGESDES